MSELELEEIKERERKATEGPWAYTSEADLVKPDSRLPLIRYRYDPGFRNHDDGEFIAHARQDIPTLIAEVECHRSTIAELRAELAEQGETIRRLEDSRE